MTDITLAGCISFQNFKDGLDNYLSREGRKKLKDEKNGESSVACDILIATDDKVIVGWPGVYSSDLKGLIFNYKKYVGISEKSTWNKGISELKKFCKDNGILSVVEFNTINTNKRFLIGTFVKYLPFLNSFLRFYIRRKGMEENIRCDIIVVTEQKSIWLWPNKGTQNLIAIKFEPEDINPEDWKEIIDKVKLIESEYGVHRETYANFYPK